MSSEYTGKTLAQIRQDILAYARRPEVFGGLLTNFGAHGITRRLVEFLALAVHSVYLWLDTHLRQAFAETATGRWLELHAAAVGLFRRAAVATEGVVYLRRTETGGVLTVPEGTVVASGVQSDGKRRLFATLHPLVLQEGEEAGPMGVRALETGTSSNLSNGSVNTLVSVVPTITEVGTWYQALVRFTRDSGTTDIIIPRYTVIEDGEGVRYHTLEAVTMPAGVDAAEVYAWPIDIDNNEPLSDEGILLVDTIPDLDSVVELVTEPGWIYTVGQDVEQDEPLRQRIRDRWLGLAYGATAPAQRAWAREVVGVRDAAIRPVLGTREVDVYIWGLLGAPTSALLTSVRTLFQQRRPIGQNTRVLPAENYALNLYIEVFLAPQYSLTTVELEALFEAALEAWFLTLEIGQAVGMSRIANVVIQAAAAEQMLNVVLDVAAECPSFEFGNATFVRMTPAVSMPGIVPIIYTLNSVSWSWVESV